MTVPCTTPVHASSYQDVQRYPHVLVVVGGQTGQQSGRKHHDLNPDFPPRVTGREMPNPFQQFCPVHRVLWDLCEFFLFLKQKVPTKNALNNMQSATMYVIQHKKVDGKKK